MFSFSLFKCRTQFRSRPIGGSSDFESAVLLQNKPIITADFLGGVSTFDIDREKKKIKAAFLFSKFLTSWVVATCQLVKLCHSTKMYKFLLGCFLVSLQLIICIQSVQLDQSPSESKTAYAVFDESNEEFVIVNHEPTRDKYVAGAKFANAINQTGYVTF